MFHVDSSGRVASRAGGQCEGTGIEYLIDNLQMTEASMPKAGMVL